MPYITEPLRGLARTSILVGIANCSLGLMFTLFAVAGWLENDDPRRLWIVYWTVPLAIVPGAAVIFVGWRLHKGHFWAAVVLVVLALIEAFKLLLFLILFGLCGAVMSLLPGALIVRVALAIPEIRFQLRARRRANAPRGFEPIMPPGERPKPPPRSLKR